MISELKEIDVENDEKEDISFQKTITYCGILIIIFSIYIYLNLFDLFEPPHYLSTKKKEITTGTLTNSGISLAHGTDSFILSNLSLTLYRNITDSTTSFSAGALIEANIFTDRPITERAKIPNKEMFYFKYNHNESSSVYLPQITDQAYSRLDISINFLQPLSGITLLHLQADEHPAPTPLDNIIPRTFLFSISILFFIGFLIAHARDKSIESRDSRRKVIVAIHLLSLSFFKMLSLIGISDKFEILLSCFYTASSRSYILYRIDRIRNVRPIPTSFFIIFFLMTTLTQLFGKIASPPFVKPSELEADFQLLRLRLFFNVVFMTLSVLLSFFTLLKGENIGIHFSFLFEILFLISTPSMVNGEYVGKPAPFSVPYEQICSTLSVIFVIFDYEFFRKRSIEKESRIKIQDDTDDTTLGVEAEDGNQIVPEEPQKV